MKTKTNIIYLAFALFALACFALLPAPKAFGVVPAPDGGYPGGNTAEGDDALFSLDTSQGLENTVVGFQALYSSTNNVHNTALGYQALNQNIQDDNEGVGWHALFNNTTGYGNHAFGVDTLGLNTTGSFNTATGFRTLNGNTTGSYNTATGYNALQGNTSGDFNTAVGESALGNNSTSCCNTAIGEDALVSNVDGNWNTAVGTNALIFFTTGSVFGNTALGSGAGSNLTSGDNNIYIKNDGVSVESNTIRIGTQGTQNRTFIAGISGSAVNGSPVKINGSGRLGVAPSSARFKDEIKPMDRASEAILALKPVTFRYKKELDPQGIPQFGLVAEEVEKVNPDLVARDDHGKPFTVRYEAVNAMLLNEFLKEHKKVEEQQATIAELKSTVAEQRKDYEAISAQQHKEIQALTASLNEQASQIQKVSAQMEIGKLTTGQIHRGGHAPQMVLNNQ
jgi:hypothetical protein